MAGRRKDAESALIVVDVQYDFLPGGSLAVGEGDAIIPLVNELGADFENVVLTQDWHPAGHVSFASSHQGAEPYSVIDLPYGKQVLWPDHCIQGTHGAALAAGLNMPHAQLVIRKGFHPEIDSYSAFYEADRKTPTGLTGYLRERGIKRVYVLGLATDFCVGWTAIDAAGQGLETHVVEDASRGIDHEGSMDRAFAHMEKAGVRRKMARHI